MDTSRSTPSNLSQLPGRRPPGNQVYRTDQGLSGRQCSTALANVCGRVPPALGAATVFTSNLMPGRVSWEKRSGLGAKVPPQLSLAQAGAAFRMDNC